mmetsp:Transcript_35696/g.75149  ORF Transcript_35696/g.75149 Transcript_35696/m.75149 type:complete len:80 (-) Transcript_35696:76-315(-)
MTSLLPNQPMLHQVIKCGAVAYYHAVAPYRMSNIASDHCTQQQQHACPRNPHPPLTTLHNDLAIPPSRACPQFTLRYWY